MYKGSEISDNSSPSFCCFIHFFTIEVVNNSDFSIVMNGFY